jgi:hypothetical protein
LWAFRTTANALISAAPNPAKPASNPSDKTLKSEAKWRGPANSKRNDWIHTESGAFITPYSQQQEQ